MALPASPSVVVLENDLSIYTPNVQSSVVGIVGFADKGPVDKATLVTDQNALLSKFGKPSQEIPGQGIEGALEILEATDQVYFVRAAFNASSAKATVNIGVCPAVQVSSTTTPLNNVSLQYSITNNDGEVVKSETVTFASSTGITTAEEILTQYFNPAILSDQELIAVKEEGNLYLVARNAGAGARLQVSSNTVEFGFSSIGIDGSSVAGGVNLTASGFTASDTGASSLVLNVYSIHPGAGYNLQTLRDGSVQGISVEIENQSTVDRLILNSEGAQREQFNVVLSPSSSNSVELLLVDDEVNNKSEFAYSIVESNGAQFDMPDSFGSRISTVKAFTNGAGATVSGRPRFVKLVEGTYSMAGGDSGYATDNDTAIIGDQASKTGMYALDDDAFSISLALIPGLPSQRIQNALITLAETTQNFIALVAPPFAVGDPQDAVNWVNGKGSGRTAALNSSYAAVYWPYQQTFNYHTGADEWYDPAIYGARQMVYTDNVADPWFAPAGFRRGRLTKPTDTEVQLNQGDKNLLYSNNINPVTKEAQNGIIIMGQKTSQRAPTALDRVNVRRLMIYIKKVLLQLGVPFQFEPSDPLTWELVEDAIRPFLSDLQARRAIVEGDVKCDKSTNTPLRTDRNELWCDISIKPTKAAETVVFQVNLTNQAATING